MSLPPTLPATTSVVRIVCSNEKPAGTSLSPVEGVEGIPGPSNNLETGNNSQSDNVSETYTEEREEDEDDDDDDDDEEDEEEDEEEDDDEEIDEVSNFDYYFCTTNQKLQF